ncbi:glycosyltransferase [Microcoleus sp. FACHB-68]|uniref:glycosyltransferase family 2 protein n=1 Tax=Microcoleus sp. FACHB-68 TaxID=2692826 RepID=UPI001687DE38|nr:glycosyltransferase [Microcoleus sp. FACHB-68]MBD1940293.1 glycosyltransferase [Microcoleus sp. FACHB-68]
MSAFIPWKVVHIELSENIPTLPAEPCYQGLYVVFWGHGIPLGHQEILADQLPMPATEVANLGMQTIVPAVGDLLLEKGFKASLPELPKHLVKNISPDFQELMSLERPFAKLEACFSEPSEASVSVVICTRERPAQLIQCLKSLQNLSQPPQEIVVVDNAPTSEATREAVAQIPNVKYVREPRPGLSVARNTGILHSTGDIIAFTDDDVRLHPEWLTRLLRGFDHPNVMSVTGLVLPAELETEAQFIFEKGLGYLNKGYFTKTFDSQFFEDMKSKGVPAWEVGAGANMAIRRKAFDLVGNFDERLGAGAAGCSEDSEFWYRLLAEGWVCRYEPAAAVYHYHRSDSKTLKHQMYHYWRGYVTALLVQFARYKHWGNLRRLFVNLPMYYASRFVYGTLKGLKSFNRLLVSGLFGAFAGVIFYFQNRQLPR